MSILDIRIQKDAYGNTDVILENSRIFCRYSHRFTEGHPLGIIKRYYQSYMMDLTDKNTGENFAADFGEHCGSFDAGSFRENLKDAYIVYEDRDEKTVRLEWERQQLEWDTVNLVPSQEITIYKDQPFLEIKYLVWPCNIVDISPMRDRKGKYVIYGAENWKRECVLYEDIYFSSCPGLVGTQNITELDDPGPLEYQGHFITALLDEQTGRGFGRVVPVDRINIIKLLFNKGFEIFPDYQREHIPFVGYLYVFRDGQEEAVTLGKRIAEFGNK